MRMGTSRPGNIWSVIVVVVVIAIVFLVGAQVMSEISQTELQEWEQQQEQIKTTCGFCQYDLIDFVSLFGIMGIGIALVYMMGFVSNRGTDPPDGVQEAKKAYIEGEISILELEDRLDDEIDQDDLEP